MEHNVKEKVIQKPPRLTVVSSYFYPKIGGLETIAYTTAKSLHQSGEYVVSVITTNYDSKGYKKEVIDGMTVHRLPVSFLFSNTPINFLWYFWVKKIFSLEKTDIVHTHSPVPYLVDIAVNVAQKRNIPTVVTYHSGSMKKGKFFIDIIVGLYERFFLRNLFKKATEVVTVHQGFMRKNYPEVAYKTHFIPTGVDLHRFVKTPVPQDTYVVTFIGRIEHSSNWKGIEQLLQAIKIVLQSKPNTKLELVGGGDAVEFYKGRAKALGISDSVRLLGPQYGEDLVKAYVRSSVVVLPSTSDSEAFSVTLVEAMASGRPIIGTSIGGTPQVIQSGENGFLVAPKNPEELAEAIIRVLYEDGLAQKMGDIGAKKSLEFSWGLQIEKYRKLFLKVLI